MSYVQETIRKASERNKDVKNNHGNNKKVQEEDGSVSKIKKSISLGGLVVLFLFGGLAISRIIFATRTLSNFKSLSSISTSISSSSSHDKGADFDDNNHGIEVFYDDESDDNDDNDYNESTYYHNVILLGQFNMDMPATKIMTWVDIWSKYFENIHVNGPFSEQTQKELDMYINTSLVSATATSMMSSPTQDDNTTTNNDDHRHRRTSHLRAYYTASGSKYFPNAPSLQEAMLRQIRIEEQEAEKEEAMQRQEQQYEVGGSGIKKKKKRQRHPIKGIMSMHDDMMVNLTEFFPPSSSSSLSLRFDGRGKNQNNANGKYRRKKPTTDVLDQIIATYNEYDQYDNANCMFHMNIVTTKTIKTTARTEIITSKMEEKEGAYSIGNTTNNNINNVVNTKTEITLGHRMYLTDWKNHHQRFGSFHQMVDAGVLARWPFWKRCMPNWERTFNLLLSREDQQEKKKYNNNDSNKQQILQQKQQHDQQQNMFKKKLFAPLYNYDGNDVHPLLQIESSYKTREQRQVNTTQVISSSSSATKNGLSHTLTNTTTVTFTRSIFFPGQFQSDVFYIPLFYAYDLNKIIQPMIDGDVFLECAIPKLLHTLLLLQERHDQAQQVEEEDDGDNGTTQEKFEEQQNGKRNKDKNTDTQREEKTTTTSEAGVTTTTTSTTFQKKEEIIQQPDMASLFHDVQHQRQQEAEQELQRVQGLDRHKANPNRYSNIKNDSRRNKKTFHEVQLCTIYGGVRNTPGALNECWEVQQLKLNALLNETMNDDETEQTLSPSLSSLQEGQEQEEKRPGRRRRRRSPPVQQQEEGNGSGNDDDMQLSWWIDDTYTADRSPWYYGAYHPFKISTYPPDEYAKLVNILQQPTTVVLSNGNGSTIMGNVDKSYQTIYTNENVSYALVYPGGGDPFNSKKRKKRRKGN